MSEFYKESNNESSIDLFNKRIIYRQDALANGSSNLIDFTFAEKAFYGKTDRDFTPIAANENLITFKNFRSAADQNSNLRALGFVVDAFEALAQQFKKAQQSGKIYSNDPNLTNLKVYKSYKNNSISYNNYRTNFNTALKENLNIKKVTNFETFIEELQRTVSVVARTYPMTRPAFTKSRLNGLTNTGFAIEIADVPYDNDEQKISEFVNSKNWNFYVNACNSYGFMIDINAPWRLVADLESEAMIGYASQYPLNTPQQILLLGFKNTYVDYFIDFPTDLLNLYNEVIPTKVVTYDECGSKMIATERYTPQSLLEKFSLNYFLELYMKIRIIEEEKHLSEPEQARLIKDSIGLREAASFFAALNKFERFINQPFDYRGSLSYIAKAQRMREDT